MQKGTSIPTLQDFKQLWKLLININIKLTKLLISAYFLSKIKVVFIVKTSDIKKIVFWFSLRIRARSFKPIKPWRLNVIQTCCPERCWTVDLLLNDTYIFENIQTEDCCNVFLRTIYLVCRLWKRCIINWKFHKTWIEALLDWLRLHAYMTFSEVF